MFSAMTTAIGPERPTELTPRQRAAQALRDLAVWIEEHDTLPVPTGIQVTAMVDQTDEVDEHTRVSAVRSIADQFGEPVIEGRATTFTTLRPFGDKISQLFVAFSVHAWTGRDGEV